jgi:hypothetical protein
VCTESEVALQNRRPREAAPSRFLDNGLVQRLMSETIGLPDKYS